MPRKRAKRTPAPRPAAEDTADLEVERRVEAIRAIRDLEIEHVLTELRLLRSCLNDDHLDSVALHFVAQILPNAVRRAEEGFFYANQDEMLRTDDPEDRILDFMRFRHSLADVWSFEGHEFQSGAGKTRALGYENLRMSDIVFDEQMENQMLGLPESLQTPGFASQRLSIGMTPKTRRMPKPGEMLLSVNGSPLGVYKEENMECINETDEG